MTPKIIVKIAEYNVNFALPLIIAHNAFLLIIYIKIYAINNAQYILMLLLVKQLLVKLLNIRYLCFRK